MIGVPKPTPTPKQPKRLQSRPRPVNPKAAADTYARDDWLCQWCRRPGGVIVPHHRLRRSQGGKDIPAHLVTVHPICHGYIHDHPAEATERGFLVQSAEDLVRGWS